MNLVQLSDNNKKLAGWREYGYGQNTGWVYKNIVPYQGMKTLLCQGECKGETVDATHVVNVQFSKLTYLNELPSDGSHEKLYELEYKGSKYYFIKPTLTDQVQVRCSCPDYNYTFSPWNFKNKAQFGGPPKKYIKKTNRKPRNPDHLPGFCKHINQFVQYLQEEGLIQ